MRVEQMEQRFNNLEGRVDRIEQILPTLATRDDLRAAIEPLATQAEVIAAIAASDQRMRTHFDVLTESLRDDIKLITAAFESLAQRMS